ncbi:tRNA methyltransferase 44 [Mortierella polycephala]|uniref:tRNA (uracil-O(2)-)-methyltransferase n=1 Tax=Mortierella polycephala TaxID=41804 RepID=A0A9P6TVH0_9FUNG|nr:tRNA methyltransferase 44 [Mortierella polycephala]
MAAGEHAVVEFAYDAVFYFDDLPNNQTHPQKQKDSKDVITTKPQWYRTAIAPVPFREEVFWNVMERWILEAPAIIPPVLKVEVIQDDVATGSGNESVTTTAAPESPVAQDRMRLLLDDQVPYRTIRRKLLPKRVAKDPIMEEQLYYCRSQQQCLGDDNNSDMKKTASSHAIFAPIIKQNIAADLDNELKTLVSTLPFYYPKIRGFRYGYQPDPEDAPEDKEDEHDCDQCEDMKNNQDQAPDANGRCEADVCVEPNQETGKQITQSGRSGWITLDLFLAGDEGRFTDKMQYAFRELFKKLFKWGINTTKGFTKSRVEHDVLVPKELYQKTYARLKEKHAQKWVQSWAEKTDAQKFVFEDIAIASWLVALWELERAKDSKVSDNQQEKKQTFMDLGCGNGLLTHILNVEGHKGTGIDIASRKIWDIYGDETQLQVKTIIPNETFPKGAPDGKYKAYQEYICSVIDTCGYVLQKENLRIPSTKNVALVGMFLKRKRGREDEEGYQSRVDQLVMRSGVFVPRISDKDKQMIQKTKLAAKMAKEAK